MKKKKIVLVGGCFDLIHFGHIHFLKKAKALGDYLMVVLESDENVKRLKGEGRPIHSQEQRRQMLGALSFVDEVIALPLMKSDKDYRKLIQKISPDVIAVTQKDPILHKKIAHAKSVAAEVIAISKVAGVSTSKIIREL